MSISVLKPHAGSQDLEGSLSDPPAVIDSEVLKSQARLLQNRGAFEEAARAWTQYLERLPGDGEAANELGLVLSKLARHEEGLVWFRRALMSQPDLVAAKVNMGLTLRHLQKFEEALSCFQQLLASQPDEALAWYHIGVSLHALKRDEEALKWLQRAHNLQPGNADAARELGNVLQALKRRDEAIEAFRRSVALQADSIPARSSLGSLLLEARLFEEAAAQFQTVVAQDPTGLGGWLSLGAALLGTHRHADALAAYRRALVLQPACAAAYCNMALALLSLGRLEEAAESCQKAIVLEPGSQVATFNLACIQLAAANFREGWESYEARYRLESNQKKWARDDVRAAPWVGEPLHGKSILVLCEQGNGDQIQFSRYVAALADLGADATFFIPKRLRRLFSTLMPRTNLIDEIPPNSKFDYQCSLMSLPWRFDRLGLPIPTAAFLSAEPERAERWNKQIGDHGFRIGIVWQGNRYASGDGFRPYPLSALRPVAALPGVRLICLQLDKGKEEIAALPEGMTVEQLGPDFDAGPDAFVDSAAVMSVVDLVISCDTSLAHLAGALHRPLWIALNEAPEWRWQRNRADSIWYPTARLFRQETRGDWDGVFWKMAQELTPLVERKAASPAPVAGATANSIPRVEVSWGELIDKVTILEIKLERLTSQAAVANVRRELEHLMPVVAEAAALSSAVQKRRGELRTVNEKLWDIEDDIRACEAERRFDDKFTELARSVYILNDERGRIKQSINAELKSQLIEEKQYRMY